MADEKTIGNPNRTGPMTGEQEGTPSTHSEKTGIDSSQAGAVFVDWVKENQTAALLVSFATGVFIGVLLRR